VVYGGPNRLRSTQADTPRWRVCFALRFPALRGAGSTGVQDVAPLIDTYSLGDPIMSHWRAPAHRASDE
jgi:hypothetical protein